MRTRNIAVLVFSAFVGFAHAGDSASVTTYKDPETRRVLTLPKNPANVPAGRALNHPFGDMAEATFADTWCKQLTYTYWSNSRHPGYKTQMNQHQDGMGFKCRKSGSNPTFVSFDTMTNSQFGATFAASVGKQLDLIDFKGIKYYYGISITALSYEMPAKGRTAYGAVPIWHRGASVDLSKVPVMLPFKFRGSIGWEELTLPKDQIRVRSWYIGLKKEF